MRGVCRNILRTAVERILKSYFLMEWGGSVRRGSVGDDSIGNYRPWEGVFGVGRTSDVPVATRTRQNLFGCLNRLHHWLVTA